MKKAAAWVTELIDGTTRVFTFGRGPSKDPAANRPADPSRRSTGTDLRKRLADVHRLEAEGVARFEIARRSGLAQDTVAMLLNMAIAKAEMSAQVGTGHLAEIGDTAEKTASSDIIVKSKKAARSESTVMSEKASRSETTARSEKASRSETTAGSEKASRSETTAGSEKASRSETTVQSEEPVESAVRGTFFRILQTRITADKDASVRA